MIGSAQRKAGIVYTPAIVATAITQWAIRAPTDVILDPSAGRGIFLDEARERLRALGARSTKPQLIGVEKDASVARDLSMTLGNDAAIITRDFMSIRRDDLVRDINVVLGNPPYVRHHNLSARSVERAARAVEGHGLSRTGNYWAYFVLHSIQLLAPGGRLALVLPGSVVHGGYSGTVRKALQRWFCRITAVFINECVFPGVEEETIIVLAETKRFVAASECDVRIGTQSITSLSLSETALCSRTRALRSGESWVRGILTDDENDVFSRYAATYERLERFATIRIGTVTGANRFFIRTVDDLEMLPLDCWRMLISKTSHLRGARLRDADVTELSLEGARVYAATLANCSLRSARVRDFVADGIALGIHRRAKCCVRQPWYAIQFNAAPHAFLTYMNGRSPAIVVNDTALSCTNTLHALYMKKRHSVRALAVGFLTTLAQLAAEIEGRSYGGGVLKLEPSEASRIPVPMVRLRNDDLDRLDALRRSGDDGQRFADKVCFGRRDRDGLDILKTALTRLRDRRWLRHDTWRNGSDVLER